MFRTKLLGEHLYVVLESLGGLGGFALTQPVVGFALTDRECFGAVGRVFAIEPLLGGLQRCGHPWIGRIRLGERPGEAGLGAWIIGEFGNGFFATADLFLGVDCGTNVLMPFAPAPTLDLAEQGLFGLPGHFVKWNAPAAAIVAAGGLKGVGEAGLVGVGAALGGGEDFLSTVRVAQGMAEQDHEFIEARRGQPPGVLLFHEFTAELG